MAVVETQAAGLKLRMLWLEVTHKCNLECVHCYTDSSPRVPHGSLSYEQWIDVLNDAAALGTAYVCFIGGEPTLNPRLADLLDHATGLGLTTEVYSNLTRVSGPLWDCFRRNSVNLATSIYSLDAAEHDSVTTRRGSHARTMANVVKAQRYGLTVRAGAVEVAQSQGVSDLASHLTDTLGIVASVDKHRKLGRVESASQDERFDELCGACASSSAMVDPNGNVFPCIMSRWLSCGNVNESSLGEIVQGGLKRQQTILRQSFERRPPTPEPSVASVESGLTQASHDADAATQCMPPCTPTCPPMLNKCPPVDWYCPPNDPGPGPCPPMTCPPYVNS